MFLRRRQVRNYALLYILLHLHPFIVCSANPISNPASTTPNDLSGDQLRSTNTEPSPSNSGPNVAMSWLLSVLWGDDSTVSVVDRRPAVALPARPAAFGPSSDVLGYMIRVEDFSLPCGDNVLKRNRTLEDVLYGGNENVDVSSDYQLAHRANHPPPEGSDISRKAESSESSPWQADLRQGCVPICFDEGKRPESAETWIALVMRGGCTFVEKIREAQRLGAKGVVVGGETVVQDTHGDGLVQMFSLDDSSDITIPSVYITHDSYRSLSSLIASSNTSTWGFKTVSAVITIDITGWQWYSPIFTFILLLFLPSILTLFTLLLHRCRAARAARRDRAPEEVVQNLPWSIWEGQETVRELEKGLHAVKAEQKPSTLHQQDQEGQGHEHELALAPVPMPIESRTTEPESSAMPIISSVECEAARRWFERQVECAICLEEFAKGDKVRVLPCLHIFHMEEVDDWLIHRKKVCPICKHDVTRPLDSDCTTTSDPEEANERTRLLS